MVIVLGCMCPRLYNRMADFTSTFIISCTARSCTNLNSVSTGGPKILTSKISFEVGSDI